MAHPSWGAGWPNCQHSRIKGIVRSDGLKVQVRQELVTLFTLLINETERLGYDVRFKDGGGAIATGGFVCREVLTKEGKPTGIPSNHSWGLAIDINSDKNPRRSPLTTDIPDNVVGLWKRFNFRWGAAFSPPDPMHFEYMGSVSDAEADTSRVLRELSGDDVTTGMTTEEATVAFELAGTTAVPGGAPDALGRFPFWGWRQDGSVFAFNGAPAVVPTAGDKKAITADGPVIAMHARTDGVVGYYLVAGQPDEASGFPTFAFPK